MRLPLILVLFGFCLSGCKGYQLGPTNGLSAGSRSVQVIPFKSDTPEPRLTEAVTGALRKRLQQDGTYRLETQGPADVIISGRITRFEREELSFQPSDILTVRDYRLLMIAEMTAVDRVSGKTYTNRLVGGRTTIRVGADLTSAERQAIPLLAADLARNAVALLVDGTW